MVQFIDQCYVLLNNTVFTGLHYKTYTTNDNTMISPYKSVAMVTSHEGKKPGQVNHLSCRCPPQPKKNAIQIQMYEMKFKGQNM